MPLAAPPAYRIMLMPELIVVDADGVPVNDAYVVEIIFPDNVIETSLARRNTIAGPDVGKIIVGDITYQGIPLG